MLGLVLTCMDVVALGEDEDEEDWDNDDENGFDVVEAGGLARNGFDDVRGFVGFVAVERIEEDCSFMGGDA